MKTQVLPMTLMKVLFVRCRASVSIISITCVYKMTARKKGLLAWWVAGASVYPISPKVTETKGSKGQLTLRPNLGLKIAGKKKTR